MVKSYNYINKIGEPKQICVETEKDAEGKYKFTLWSMRTGDFCGAGALTDEKLKEWFDYYNINA